MKRDMGLERLLASLTAVDVQSQANGYMLVMLEYRTGNPGVMSRMAIAAELETVIRNRINRAKQALVKVKA